MGAVFNLGTDGDVGSDDNVETGANVGKGGEVGISGNVGTGGDVGTVPAKRGEVGRRPISKRTNSLRKRKVKRCTRCGVYLYRVNRAFHPRGRFPDAKLRALWIKREIEGMKVLNLPFPE